MKRMMCVLAAAVLMLSLCACGGQKAETEETGQLTWQEQYDLGIRYMSEGNYEEAIIAFTAAIEIDAKRAEAYVGRGNAYIGAGETDESLAAALADYEKAIELDAANVDAYMGLADVYIRRGDYEKAREILEEALEKTGNSQVIADKLAEMDSGTIMDSAGKARRMTTYDASGAVLFWHEYTYNSDNKRSSVTSFDASGTQTGYVGMEYDANGNRLSDYYYLSDGTVGKTAYELDEQGREIKETHYSPKGELEFYSLFEYDDNDNCIKESRYIDGELVSYDVWEYKDNGDRIRYEYWQDTEGNMMQFGHAVFTEDGDTYYGQNGELLFRTVTIRDENGKVIGRKEYDAEGNLVETTLYE